MFHDDTIASSPPEYRNPPSGLKVSAETACSHFVVAVSVSVSFFRLQPAETLRTGGVSEADVVCTHSLLFLSAATRSGSRTRDYEGLRPSTIHYIVGVCAAQGQQEHNTVLCTVNGLTCSDGRKSIGTPAPPSRVLPVVVPAACLVVSIPSAKKRSAGDFPQVNTPRRTSTCAQPTVACNNDGGSAQRGMATGRRECVVLQVFRGNTATSKILVAKSYLQVHTCKYWFRWCAPARQRVVRVQYRTHLFP